MTLRKCCVAMVVALTVVVSGCGADEESAESTTSTTPVWDVSSPPENVVWVDVHGLAIPTSLVSGPKNSMGVAASSYEHSPQGAVLAAIGTSMRLSVATDAEWPEVISRSVAPGPARDEWTLARAQVSVTGVDESFIPAIEGYEITKYSDQEAFVDVFSSYPDSSLTKTTMMVVWADGDWKYVLPEDAKLDSPVAEIQILPEKIVELSKT